MPILADMRAFRNEDGKNEKKTAEKTQIRNPNPGYAGFGFLQYLNGSVACGIDAPHT
jgi:hypothetical protein